MSTDLPSPPRPVADLSGGQMADVRIDAAGRDRINQGLTGDEVRLLLQNQQEFSLTMVSAYEKLYNDLSKQIRNVQHDVELRFEIDQGKRYRRQWVLNAWLGAITASVALMAIGWIYLLIKLWPTLTAVALTLGGAR